MYDYKGDKCLDQKSQYYDIVNRGDRAYSGVGRPESELFKEGLSGKVALLESPGGCTGISGCLRQRE